jgi:hypothetical protein
MHGLKSNQTLECWVPAGVGHRSLIKKTKKTKDYPLLIELGKRE